MYESPKVNLRQGGVPADPRPLLVPVFSGRIVRDGPIRWRWLSC